MKLFKTIIIDDEALAIEVIKHYLSMFPNYQLVQSFTNPTEAFAFLKQHQVDLVFTDIAMPELSGIDLVKLLHKDTQFVMTTSFSEFAIESFELNVVDYLLKPIPLERFAKTLERFEALQQKHTQEEASFFVKDGDEFIKVYIDQIDYIEGMKDYAKIICGKRYYMVLKTLKSLNSFLEAHQFLRIHKSFIVPLKKIIQSNPSCVIIGEHEIPVDPSYRKALRAYLNSRKLS